MSLQDKYRKALDLGLELGVQNGFINEADGKLIMGGTASTAYHKDLIWDAIKKAGGESPSDIIADINVAITDYYTLHTVVSGDSLSKLSKKYYDNMSHYMQIFEANRDQLKDPDMIKVGQVLTIPNLA